MGLPGSEESLTIG